MTQENLEEEGNEEKDEEVVAEKDVQVVAEEELEGRPGIWLTRIKTYIN